MIYFVFPTFKESHHIRRILSTFSLPKIQDLTIVIVNANFGDETTKIIKNYKIANDSSLKIVEIAGVNKEFWSATVNRGFQYVSGIIKEDDSVILCNVDIDFDLSIISHLKELALKYNNRAVLSPMSLHPNRIVRSSGVKIINWFFDIKLHPLAGMKFDSINKLEEIEVNFLATRFIFIPYNIFKLNNTIAERVLPHYAADYDFTNKISRLGFKLYLVPKYYIIVDAENTGLSVYSYKKSNIFLRFSSLFSIKNPSNPFIRIVFLYRNYPLYSFFYVSLKNLMIIFIECLFGGRLLKKVIKVKNRGIS